MHINIPGKPFGFYIRMNSERTRCELLNLGKNLHCNKWNADKNFLHCRIQGERKESSRSEDSLGFHRNHSTE